MIFNIMPFLFKLYYKNFIVLILMNCFLFGVIYLLFLEKKRNKTLKSQKKDILKYILQLEKNIYELEEINHENINQLLIIKSLKPEEKNQYIKEIINLKKEKEKVIAFNNINNYQLKTFLINKNLQASHMNTKINFKVIGKINLSTKKKKLINIIKVLAIIIDNAIEAVQKNQSKEILITIIQRENIIEIEISNYLEKKVDLKIIYKRGYTTKKEGSGMGLYIANKIISKNKEITLKTNYSKPYFIQTIKILK